MNEKKWELYVYSTYIYLNEEAKAIKLATQLLALGVDIQIRVKKIEKDK